jgi:mannose-1-phosphate guanylyltransferase/mannose-6-phosphate isomerase
MQSVNIQPVIICGGSGTRLWPMSRTTYPKQFLNLLDDESLFQRSAKRIYTDFSSHSECHKPLIVCNEEHRFLVMDQLEHISVATEPAILEPEGRNTAPALTLAALAAMDHNHDPVCIVTPADQIVEDVDAFQDAIHHALPFAEQGGIVMLGIPPTEPATAYGYIKCKGNQTVRDVMTFVEKPDHATAKKYVESGNYYWNSGIFILKASLWMEALQRYRPDIAEATEKAWTKRKIGQHFVRFDPKLFSNIPSESIDYAVMEKCVGDIPVHMVPLVCGWNDLGSWDAIWKSANKDADGNLLMGDTIVTDCENIQIHASHRLVGAVGLKEIEIIETPDAILVADRNHSQNIKQVVSDLHENVRSEHIYPRKVYRPWGWYDCIEEGTNFKVKRIMVKPGASLSLQRHQKRAEHWVVVSGTADVTCGDNNFLLHQNQSTYIPLGEVHRLSNPGTQPLEIIEIQSGDYLGEDDIERLEDNYGRTK